LLRLLEAVLFASAEPLSEQDLAEYLTEDADVPALLALLVDEYAARGVNLVRAGNGWLFATAPDVAPFLTRQRRVEKRLSRAGIETLAVIAYHQPVTRGEIEEIRGVQLSKGTLDALFEQGWIEPRGHRETPGRPATWRTTDAFLRHFRLTSLSDLPAREELRAAGLLDARPAIRVLQPDSSAEDDTGAVPEPLDPDPG
jgi:segregation and condensation protein B